MVRRCLASIAPEAARSAYRKLRDKLAIHKDGVDLLKWELARHLRTTKSLTRPWVYGDSKLSTDQISHAQCFTSGLLSFAHEVIGQVALSCEVEPRSPFSDRRVIEFALRMPIDAKLCAPWYKHTLRKSMDGILPEAVRWRRDIGGHPGSAFYQQLISGLARHAPEIWNLDYLGSTLSRWIDGSPLNEMWCKYAQVADYYTGYRLYALVMLARWLKMHPQMI